MKIEIFNIDEFIKINNLFEITDPIYINKDKTPTENGLFSYKLGFPGTKDRKMSLGYIDLK